MMRPLCLLFLLLLSWTLCRGQAGVSNLVCTFSDGCSCYLFTQRENRKPATDECDTAFTDGTVVIKAEQYNGARSFHGLDEDSMLWTDAAPGRRHMFFFRNGQGRSVRKLATGYRLRSRHRRGGCVAFSTRRQDYLVRRCSSGFKAVCVVPRPISTNIYYEATLSWQAGGPPDLDFKTINSECEISFGSQFCASHGGAGTMELQGDQLSCCGPGEVIQFSGDFSAYSLKTLIYVHVYATGAQSITVSQTKFTFTEAGYPDFVVSAPDGHLGERYWIVGCIEPAYGACSFKPIQLYSWSAPTDASICP